MWMFPIRSLSGRYLCTSYGIIDKPSDDHSNNCADCVDNEIAHARVATWDPVLRDLKCSGKNGHSKYLINWGGAICRDSTQVRQFRKSRDVPAYVERTSWVESLVGRRIRALLPQLRSMLPLENT